MKLPMTLVLTALAAPVMISCSTFEAKEANQEDYHQADGADRGGAQFETAIWSSDPKKKTLPKALGTDGKEK
ncbi:MAG: hypothetical protein AAF571_04965 [Verrucomicrobiota bacterium]